MTEGNHTPIDGRYIEKLMYIGPYERWLYGKGQPYAFPTVRQFKKGYLSGIVEWDEGLWPQKNSMHPVFVPTLWHDKEHDEDEAYSPLFMPILSYHDAPLDIEAIIEFREQLDSQKFTVPQRPISRKLTQSDGQKAQSEPSENVFPRLRVNFPIAEGSVNRAFNQADTLKKWRADESLATAMANTSDKKRLTIVAVIDDGIPFAHRNFRKPDGSSSRVEYCWIQSAKPLDEEKPTVLYGREYVRNEIDDLIARHNHDEDALYKDSGAEDISPEYGTPLNRHASHGAVTLDLAAGYQRGIDPEPREDVRIIAVQLPNVIAWDTSGFGKDSFMLAAFHYIFDRADQLRRAYGASECPLVINLSFGSSGGPHDVVATNGSVSAFRPERSGVELESAIDQLVQQRRKKHPTAVVLPSGNNFSDQLHAVIRQQDFDDNNSTVSVNWRIQPNDRSPNFLEIWLPLAAQPADYKIELEDPNGNISTKTLNKKMSGVEKMGDAVDYADLFDANISNAPGQISNDLFRGRRRRFLIIVGPTESESDMLLVAPPGKWKVTIARLSSIKETLVDPVLLWIQRDENLDHRRSGARQSYLETPGYLRFDETGKRARTDEDGSLIRRFGTMNGIATALTIMPVAGYNRTSITNYAIENGAIASDYSSAGPLEQRRGEFGKSVLCSTLTDRGPGQPGRLAAGTRSGALGRVVGTSTASPQVARRLAEFFADPTHSIEDIQAAAINNYVSLVEGIGINQVNVTTASSFKLARLGKKMVKPVRT